MRRRAFRSPSGRPSSEPLPELGLRSPRRSFTAVVLPAPLGPRTPTPSPRGTDIVSPARATFLPKRLVSSTVLTASVPAAAPPPPAGGAAPPPLPLPPP